MQQVRWRRSQLGGRAAWAAGGALALFAALAAAHAAEPGLGISHPWMRMVVPTRPAAGYFTLTNDSAKPHSLVGAASSACGMLMLHKSVHTNGEESMVMVQSILIAAHGSVKFAPGGYHLMCMQPTDAVVPGHTVRVTLRFADGSALSAPFRVRGATGN